MSKKKLKAYLQELNREELQEQILELHDRLKEVKEFYAFVFNPQEEKLFEEAKFKFTREYFPVKNRKPKRRRSVAQKTFKEYKKLGVQAEIIAELMVYNLEVAILYNEQSPTAQDAFFKGMLNFFKELVSFVDENGLQGTFNEKIEKVNDRVWQQDWVNKLAFETVLDKRIV